MIHIPMPLAVDTYVQQVMQTLGVKVVFEPGIDNYVASVEDSEGNRTEARGASPQLAVLALKEALFAELGVYP